MQRGVFLEVIKNAAVWPTWPECKQLYIHLQINFQMDFYLFTFSV